MNKKDIRRIAKFIRENDSSADSEPLIFIRKDDLEEFLGLPHYYFSDEDINF